MIFRKSSGSPTDISCAREGALDKATYVASHRSSCEKKRGNFQWKMRPGFARRHKRFGRIFRGVVFSRFRINGRMVARRCCLSYGWPTGPTKNARCEDSGQKRRRGLILVVLECCLYADMYLSAQALLVSADLSGGARGLLGRLKRPGGAWLRGCAAGGDALLDMVFRHCYSSPGMGQLMNGHPYLSRFGG